MKDIYSPYLDNGLDMRTESTQLTINGSFGEIINAFLRS